MTPEHETIALSSRLRFRAVGEEGVLVHLDSGRVIVVNEVGLHVVEQLGSPKTREALAESIMTAFDVDETRATSDLESFLADLDKEEVLEHSHVQD